MHEGTGDEAVADAGVLEPVEGESDFGGAARADFSSGEKARAKQRFEMSNRSGRALQRCLRVEGVGELDSEVAVVTDGSLGEFCGGVEFVKFPLREGRIHPGETRAGSGSETLGDDDAESVEKAAAVAVFAAVVEPEDAKGEDAVDDGGWFLRSDADDGPGGLAFDEDAACVGGAEAVLEIHGGPEGFGGQAGEVGGE